MQRQNVVSAVLQVDSVLIAGLGLAVTIFSNQSRGPLSDLAIAAVVVTGLLLALSMIFTLFYAVSVYREEEVNEEGTSLPVDPTRDNLLLWSVGITSAAILMIVAIITAYLLFG